MERIFLYPFAGPGGRNYFKQIGTAQDVILSDIKLEEGVRLSFYCEDVDDEGRPDELLFDGTVHFDFDKGQWYTITDENSYHHAFHLRSRIRRSD
jgi:hypothetical protein